MMALTLVFVSACSWSAVAMESVPATSVTVMLSTLVLLVMTAQ